MSAKIRHTEVPTESIKGTRKRKAARPGAKWQYEYGEVEHCVSRCVSRVRRRGGIEGAEDCLQCAVFPDTHHR